MICHVEMQLNDVIKVSVGIGHAFIALPILIRYHQNSTDTNTGIGIGASLTKTLLFVMQCCNKLHTTITHLCTLLLYTPM